MRKKYCSHALNFDMCNLQNFCMGKNLGRAVTTRRTLHQTKQLMETQMETMVKNRVRIQVRCDFVYKLLLTCV